MWVVMDLLAYMGVFDVEVEITGNDVVNAYLPDLFGFGPASKSVLFVTPPVIFGFKLFKFHGFGFVVVFYAIWVGVFVKPDIFSLCAFGEKQDIGFNAGICGKHAIG